jgi:glyoxalase superfamily protein
VKNRLHLDLDTTDVALEVDRPSGLGATWLYDSPHQDDVFTTMADPEATSSASYSRSDPWS